jgi:hypothetical protein
MKREKETGKEKAGKAGSGRSAEANGAFYFTRSQSVSNR